MPPRSKAFHALVGEVLAPAMRSEGFERPKGIGLRAWARPSRRSWLVVWVQLSKWNYGDDSEGYEFTLEMQLGDGPVTGLGTARQRLYHALSNREQVEFFWLHAAVMAKVVPDPNLESVLAPEAWAEHLEELEVRPFTPMDDPWMRYTDESDVRAWLEFITRVLPEALRRFEAAAERSGSIVG